MVITRTRDGGLELIEYHAGQETPPTDAPLTFVMIAADYQGQTLILYTHERRQWELPGGAIEPGETPQQAAVRELMEETGQVAAAYTYQGLFKIRLVHRNRYEYGMMYTATLDSLLPFTANAEAERILLWDRVSELDGHFGELNRALLDCCSRNSPH